ncbi:MAG TPA: hypothetical protein VJ891_16265, partial [Casimicrobiaceae bacterium]|nr:hypothetical protein [Casimicrobiaceae bacterium]
AIYTVADGEARVMRKTTWYRLDPGARAERGDIVEAAEREQVMLELPRGGIIAIVGPSALYAETLADEPKPPPASITLLRGWLKFSNAPKAPPIMLALRGATLKLADGIVVVHCDPTRTEFFVERGRVSLVMPVARGKDAVRDATDGEFWHRIGDRAFESDDHPASTFVAAMPPAFRDALPSLASHFETAPPPLASGREVTFAEAEPWLNVSAASRRAFVRRFATRLSDPTFRAQAATAHPIPEWDRTLHPERYRPREDAGAAASNAATTPIR